MKFDMEDYENRPWLPWKDQSTADAFRNLRQSFEHAIRCVRADPMLTPAEIDARVMGMRLVAEQSFKRYGGLPHGLFD